MVVLDVLDHLTVAEPQYWQWMREGMKEPATLTRGASPDEDFLWYGVDRTVRDRTAAAREPKGQAGPPRRRTRDTRPAPPPTRSASSQVE